MEDKIVCPNCLGYGCCIILIDFEGLIICSAYDRSKRKCTHNYQTRCECKLCNGTGFVDWIDLLFEFNGPFSDSFERLRNNIKEVESLIQERMPTEWKRK